MLQFLLWHPGLTFQYDNSRLQTARVAMNYRQACPTVTWLTRSQDLSSIEHIWNIIGRQLQQSQNIDYLAQKQEATWHEIPQDYIRELYRCMPSQMVAYVQTRGGSTLFRLPLFVTIKLWNKSFNWLEILIFLLLCLFFKSANFYCNWTTASCCITFFLLLLLL